MKFVAVTIDARLGQFWRKLAFAITHPISSLFDADGRYFLFGLLVNFLSSLPFIVFKYS